MDRIEKLKLDYTAKNETYNKRLGELEIYQERYDATKSLVDTEEKEILKLDKVALLLKKTSEYTREQAKKQIEKLVSGCLCFIFEEEISFEIEFKDTKKNSADFYVITDYNGYLVKTDPTHSRGGGVVDIVALALRVAFIQTAQPQSEGVLILDEPAKHVSDEYINRVSDFIKKITDSFNRQIIMVTHSQNLSTIGDRSLKVELEESISKITILN